MYRLGSGDVMTGDQSICERSTAIRACIDQTDRFVVLFFARDDDMYSPELVFKYSKSRTITS